jgi:hypothetical protein
MAVTDLKTDTGRPRGTIPLPEPGISQTGVPVDSQGRHRRPGVGFSIRKAIRHYCLACVEMGSTGVERCEFFDCPLWPHRFGVEPATARKRGKQVGTSARTPMQAIRANCVQNCMAGQPREVVLCPSVDCPLWRLRFGRSPTIAREQGCVVDPEVGEACGWRQVSEGVAKQL